MLSPTPIASELVVLALNSGSSSLKFGLYRVRPTKAELLLTGEAEAIGGERSQFRAQDLRNNALPVATSPIPTQRKLLPALGNSLTIAAHRLPSQSVTVSFMADRSCGSIA